MNTPNGNPAETADGFMLMIHGCDYEFQRDDGGWYATREDGAVTEYYGDDDDLIAAIKDDTVRYD